ncbi:MAG: UDP-N-acetylglucosamine diphosphorylase [Clostridia bacterium]|nr:UDP-N-acetylglucosamine diphosphorylase [Clostridia bacterium]
MTFEEYEQIEKKRMEINIAHMQKGVIFTDLRSAYIDESVEIGEGTKIGPCVTLEGNTKIGKNVTITQNTRIKDSVIGDGTEVQSSVILESSVGCETKVGPFAYMRPNSKVGDHCKIGDFVEIKNSSFGNGSKASHLTYIGDADVGSEVNLGCGVVFVNYDGSHKYRTTVGDGAFVGCNTNLVSPVTVEEGSYIAAGSTVTTTVPKGSLCVARAKARVIEGWVARRGLIKSR